MNIFSFCGPCGPCFHYLAPPLGHRSSHWEYVNCMASLRAVVFWLLVWMWRTGFFFCHFVLLHCLIILHCLPCCGLICLHARIFLFPFQVTEIRLKYFDTVPVAAAMCVLKTGFLFVASEFGNQWVVLLLSHFTLVTIKVGEREVVSRPCSFSWECFTSFRTKVLPSSFYVLSLDDFLYFSGLNQYLWIAAKSSFRSDLLNFLLGIPAELLSIK